VTGDQPSERRKKQRFLARDGCLVSLGNDPIKPWQILDISEEGLAFRYIGGADEPEGVSELDILTGDTALCIEQIPIRVISNLGLSDPVSRRSLKRCSVRFVDLSADQIARLGSFIRDYTAPAPICQPHQF
jgi:hypothetical protein